MFNARSRRIEIKSMGLMKKSLAELKPESTNVLVVALILNKTEPNIFLSKNDTNYRGVMNLTIRDSRQHVVNCTFWGKQEAVEEYSTVLKLGDIVDIIQPKIQIQNEVDSKQSRYQPTSTLPIILVLNEGEGYIQPHDYHDEEICSELRQLWALPHRPLSYALQLNDLQTRLKNYKEQIYVCDFLVAVGLIKHIREFKNNAEKKTKHCMEVIVFDQSLLVGMSFIVWQFEWIERAQQCWQPMSTILHLIDVKVAYSEFYKNSVLTFTSRSLIYENPLGLESRKLLQFVGTLPSTQFQEHVHLAGNQLPNPEQIQNVMTIMQIYGRIWNEKSASQDAKTEFTAVLYAMVTKFDLDVPDNTLSKRCKFCKRMVHKSVSFYNECQCANSSQNPNDDHFEYIFNINVQFSDQSGTLLEARLSDTIANRILCITCDNYFHLMQNDEELDKLKWSFLLNYFAVKLLIRPPKALSKKLSILIIDMEPINLSQLSKNITVY